MSFVILSGTFPFNSSYIYCKTAISFGNLLLTLLHLRLTLYFANVLISVQQPLKTNDLTTYLIITFYEYYYYYYYYYYFFFIELF